MKAKQKAYGIYSPHGRLMTTTIAMSSYAAKKKCLDPVEQKYHGLVNGNFAKWEKKGYVCAEVLVTFERKSRFRGAMDDNDSTQEYYRIIDVKQQRFLKDLEELFDKHSVSLRLMAGEIDLLGDGFRFTPLSLFEALEERKM